MSFMIWWWGSRTHLRRLSSGHFECPRCRGRRLFIVIQQVQVQTLWGLPLASTPLGTFVQCDTCKQAFDTSVTPDTMVIAAGGKVDDTWACPKCTKSNPNNRYQCQSCGYSLV